MADNLLSQIRSQHPEYNDLTDQQLSDGLYKKFYSDMPRDQFNAKVGFSPQQEAADVKGVTDVVTQPDFIKGVAANVAPSVSQSPSLGDQAKRQLGLTGRYLTEGMMSLPNMAGDAVNSLINIGHYGLERGGGTMPQQPPGLANNSFAPQPWQPMQTTTQATQDVLKAAGVPEPQTPLEKIVAEPSRMIASIPSYAAAAPLTGIKALSPLAENLKAQLYGALGSGTALGITKQITDNPYYQMAASVLGGAGGYGLSNALDNRSLAKEATNLIPTTQQVKQAGSDAYDAADKAGLIIKPQAVQNLKNNIEKQLAEEAYDPDMHPKISIVLKKLNQITQPVTDESGNTVGQNITAKQMQILRRLNNSAVLEGGPAEQRLGLIVRNNIDSFMEGIQPSDVLQGNSDQAVEGLQQGAQQWKMYRKAKDIEQAANRADLNAAASGTGGNLNNTTRQAIKSILLDPKKLAGYTPDEIAQMNEIVRGGKMTNALRMIGRISPTSGMLSSTIGGGAVGSSLVGAAATGNPLVALGAALPAVGYGAKTWADARTLGAVQGLLQLIRSGGTQESLNAAMNPAAWRPQDAIAATGAYPGLLQGLLEARRVAPPALGLLPYGGLSATANQPIDTQSRGR